MLQQQIPNENMPTMPPGGSPEGPPIMPPTMPPEGPPTMPPEGQMSPLDNIAPSPMGEAEMAADLEDRFDMITRKKAELDTKKITDTNKIEEVKKEILGKFFQAMEEFGVDMNDPSSISEFLQDLEQKDPDFVSLLETAFNVLGPQNQESELPPEDLTNKFSGLQENILRNV